MSAMADTAAMAARSATADVLAEPMSDMADMADASL